MMGLGMSGSSANLDQIVVCKLYALVNHNAGATLLNSYIMSMILNVLVGLEMGGISGMKPEIFVMVHIQVKSMPSANFLNI
jgi:hypothetical protein